MPHQHWLGKLANLNAAKSAGRGIAPHKPLMMFTVMDLIESGDVPDGWVKYDVRLVSRFRDYWELVRERQKNKREIPMPFHALGGDRDKVWERFTADGQPSRFPPVLSFYGVPLMKSDSFPPSQTPQNIIRTSIYP